MKFGQRQAGLHSADVAPARAVQALLDRPQDLHGERVAGALAAALELWGVELGR